MLTKPFRPANFVGFSVDLFRGMAASLNYTAFRHGQEIQQAPSKAVAGKCCRIRAILELKREGLVIGATSKPANAGVSDPESWSNRRLNHGAYPLLCFAASLHYEKKDYPRATLTLLRS